MLNWVIPLLCISQTSDELAVLRYEPTSPIKSGSVVIDNSFLSPGTAKGNDTKFFAIGGKQPVRFTFGLDIDGDMQDEIGVLSEWVKLDKGYRLTLHQRPAHLFDDISKPLVKSKMGEIGSRQLFGAIVAADGVDLDGIGSDELMLVRQTSNGSQRLEIYRLPSIKGEIEPAIASFTNLGNAAADEILDAVGLDFDMDNRDEIALLCRNSMGELRIDLLRSPQSPGDAIKILIASDRNDPQTGEIVGIESIDLDGDGRDEILLERAAQDGITELEPYQSPANSGEVLTPIPGVLPLMLANSGSNPLFSAFVLRGAGPKIGPNGDLPPEALFGNKFTCFFEHDIPNGYLGATHSKLIPIVNAVGKFDKATKTFSVQLPTGQTISGKFNTLTDSFAPGATALALPDSNLFASMLSLFLEPANVDVFGSTLVVAGDYAGTIAGGFVPTPGPITNGKFIFISQN